MVTMVDLKFTGHSLVVVFISQDTQKEKKIKIKKKKKIKLNFFFENIRISYNIITQ